MRETLTDLLDVLAVLLLAAGVGCLAGGGTALALRRDAGLTAVTVGLGLFAAGAVVLLGSWLASRPPRSAGDREPDR